MEKSKSTIIIPDQQQPQTENITSEQPSTSTSISDKASTGPQTDIYIPKNDEPAQNIQNCGSPTFLHNLQENVLPTEEDCNKVIVGSDPCQKEPEGTDHQEKTLIAEGELSAGVEDSVPENREELQKLDINIESSDEESGEEEVGKYTIENPKYIDQFTRSNPKGGTFKANKVVSAPTTRSRTAKK